VRVLDDPGALRGLPFGPFVTACLLQTTPNRSLEITVLPVDSTCACPQAARVWLSIVRMNTAPAYRLMRKDWW
jgi:hypothetical protein